jgi:hypothetical protein
MLAQYYNNFACGLVTGPESARDPQRALARRAVELAPGAGLFLTSLGAAQYRPGRCAEAVTTLEKSLAANRGEHAAFDLFFLAIAQHGLGHRAAARDWYDRGVRWVNEQKGLDQQESEELSRLRAEAESVLAGPAGSELPEDVFAGPR